MKTVLITGATSGLGLSHAVYLASKDYRVIGTGRDISGLQLDSLAEAFKRDHMKYKITNDEPLQVSKGKSVLPDTLQNAKHWLEQVKYYSMDIRDTSTIQSTIKQVWEEHGPIDVLVNNAGIGYFGPAEDITEEQVQNQFATNYFGHVNATNTILPLMRQHGTGLIINTSSLGGRIGIPYQAHYSASKAALSMFTESVMLELKNQPIDICTIDPGDINTSFNAKTAELLGKEDLTSVDLEPMVQAYSSKDQYADANKVWKVIVKNLILSPPPLIVSKKLDRIIRSKRHRVHYRVGNPLQSLGVPFMKRILPENLGVNIIGMFYGI